MGSRLDAALARPETLPLGLTTTVSTVLKAAMAVLVIGVLSCGTDANDGSLGSDASSEGGVPTLPPPTVPVGDLPQASRVAAVEGFDNPESARHHPGLDLYFVSNIGGGPTERDNNGFISRVTPDGTIEQLRFIAGGENGVELDAPKGLRILGDTLWVADITHVRTFDVRSGEPLFEVDLAPAGAVFLNALDRGGDGAMYITDSGLRFNRSGEMRHTGPDRVYRLQPDGQVTVALESAALEAPNGIDWDERTRMFVIASNNGQSLWAWPTHLSEPVHLVLGVSGYDGALSLPDGRVFASSWGAQSVQMLWSSGGLQTLIPGLEQPADIGFDLTRDRLLIPLLGPGRLEVWELR